MTISMKKIIILLGFLGFATLAWSQQYTTKQATLPCVNKDFNLVAHILRDSMGETNILESDIEAAVDTLNSYYAPICMSFTLCEVLFIDNFQYDDTENENEWTELKVKYLQDNRINVFFVNTIDWDEDMECGFTDQGAITMVESAGGILMKKDCTIEEPKSLIHEMGHFFGLYHTFETEFGEETVNGDNCEEAGDLVCDTPADPYEIGNPVENYVDVEQGCRFIDASSDANGQVYIPHVGNFMSYYPDTCKCGFTYGQYQRMVGQYELAPVKYW